jgi:hypothetical protein
MTTLDQAITGAVRHAKDAAMRNRGLTACPYPGDGTSIQRASRRRWVAEYNRRRPDPGAVDFRDDVEILAAGDDREGPE